MTIHTRISVLAFNLILASLLTFCSSVDDIENYTLMPTSFSTPYVEQPKSTPSLDTEISDLLASYGWTIDLKLSSHSITLPKSLQHYPGDFPYVIYWAYNNEFNKEIGLDLLPYLGQTVQANLYLLNEPLPEVFRPHENARAIVITSGDDITGAWIEKVAGFACSLDRKQFDELVEQDWNEWLVSSGVVDLSNKLDKALSTMEPEEIIETYYTALNEHNYQLLNTVRSRKDITFDLFVNKDELALFNRQEDATITLWVDNIENAQLISVQEVIGNPRNCLPVYAATVEFQFVNPRIPTISEGERLRFVVLNEEIDGLGWRIEEINTAPGVSHRLCAP